MEEVPDCYANGQILTLQVGAAQEAFNVVVEKSHGTWTTSVTLLVKVLENDAGVEVTDKPMFLKLYDRRYAPDFRERWDVTPWTPEIEEDLLEFSQVGAARDVLDAWRDNPAAEYDFSAPPYHKEALLSEIMTREFERESEAYSVLRAHQGIHIPELVTTVTMQTGPAEIIADDPISLLEDPEILGDSPEMFEVNGFLFEYVPGFPATNIDRQCDPGDWEHLKRRCTLIVGLVMNSDVILHEDVKPQNLVINTDPRCARNYRVVMTDFRATLMRDTETDEEWADMKRRYDEAGEIRAKLDNPKPRRKPKDTADGYRVYTASAWWNIFDEEVRTGK